LHGSSEVGAPATLTDPLVGGGGAADVVAAVGDGETTPADAATDWLAVAVVDVEFDAVPPVRSAPVLLDEVHALNARAKPVATTSAVVRRMSGLPSSRMARVNATTTAAASVPTT
jgi:hypothetical protein